MDPPQGFALHDVHQTLSRHELEGLWRRQDRESLKRLRYLAWAGLYGWTAVLYVDALDWAIEGATVLLPVLRVIGATLIIALLVTLRREWSSSARYRLVTLTVWVAMTLAAFTAALAARPCDLLVPLFAVAAVLRLTRGRWMSLVVAAGTFAGVVMLVRGNVGQVHPVLWGAAFAGLVAWLLHRSDVVSYRNALLIERQRVLLDEAHRTLTATPAPARRGTLRDELTGVGNRDLFDDALDRSWRRARRERSPLALVLVDLDHMDLYNALYGHEAGDGVLRKVAEALRGALWRPSDQVSRFGGQVFAVLLPGTDGVGARVVASRLREAVAGLGIAHDEAASGRVTVSLGGSAAWPAQEEEETGPEVLVERADAAVVRAKEAGRNRAVVDGGGG